MLCPIRFAFPEREEQDGGEADRGLLRASRRGQDQTSGHEIPARILRSKRSGNFFAFLHLDSGKQRGRFLFKKKFLSSSSKLSPKRREL